MESQLAAVVGIPGEGACHVKQPGEVLYPFHVACEPDQARGMARYQVVDANLVAHASTHVSLDPPPWEEFTTSEPARSATRVSPPGSTQVSRPVTANGRKSI